MVFLVSHVSGQRQTWIINGNTSTGEELHEALRQREGDASDVVLQCQGRIIGPTTLIDGGATVVATLRLFGGKGGFGSMLRAIGAQIEKTTNREACRDLSGRRLRDINEEKRLKDFIAKKADRERELQERKRQKFKMLQESPRHTFQDESYFQQRELREKNLYDSLDKAFEKKDSGSTRTKRSLKEEPVAKVKRRRFMDDLEDSSSEEEEKNDEDTNMQQTSDDSNSSTNNSNSNGSEKSVKQDDDQKPSIPFPETKKDSGSSGAKQSLKKEPVARIKKRFMNDLDESSSEEEESEAKTQHNSQSSTSSSTSRSSENDTKQEEDKEATCKPTDGSVSLQ